MKMRAFPVIRTSERTGASVPMRLKFLRWLFVCAMFAFIASLFLSFAFETHSMRREVQNMILSKISEANEHSQHAKNTLQILKSTSAEIGLKNARIVARVIENNPSLIVEGEPEKSTANLDEIGKLLKIDEIDVYDGKGICIATWPTNATQVGFDIHDGQKIREFLEILDDPTRQISQEIRQTEGSAFSGRFQFSAVARRDKPGIVEIGFRATDVEKAYELADLSRYVSSIVGYTGFLSIYQQGRHASGPDYSSQLDLDDLDLGEVNTVVINDRNYLVCAEKIDDCFYLGGIPTAEIFSARRLTIILLVITNFIIFFVVFLLVSTLVQRLIVDSVYAVNRSLAKITNGDLGERVDVSVSREFVELSNGVNATVDSLKQVVAEIKQRTEEELLLAKKIQAAALPNLDELFSDKTNFDVCAQNHPMTSVGGDMYDFFMIDGNTIVFYVADVSGHGVPASLVMMKTMALVKNLALSGYDLDKVVQTTNVYLSENNDSSFVTGFFCKFNLATGELVYVNAGHNAPFIRRGNGSFEEFDPEISLILGIEPEAEYFTAKTKLAPGDVFILYTDGITEATTPAIVECFESNRALDALNSLPRSSSSRELVDALYDAVDKFTNHADPSDDETVLVFRYISAKNEG